MNHLYEEDMRMPVNHLRIGWVLFKRDLTRSVFSPAPYIATTVSCLVSTFVVINYLDTLEKVSVLVSIDPSGIPLFVAVVLMSLYLGVSSSISITEEKEHRTLEILFYGPVTSWSLVLAKFCRDLTVFFFVLLFYVFFLLVESSITNLAIGPQSFKSMGIAFFLIWPMISFSLFLSAAMRRVRNAVVFFVIIFFVLAGLQVSHDLLLRIPPQSISLFLLYVRETLSIISKVLQWVSPFSYIAQTTYYMIGGVFRHAEWHLLFAVLYSSFILITACLVLKKKGMGG